MSLERMFYLLCDVDPCSGGITPAEFRTAKDARTAAKRIGWTRRAGMDLCPEHSGPVAAPDPPRQARW